MNKLYSEIMLVSTAGFEMREIEENIRILTTDTSLCRYNPVGMQKKVLQFLCDYNPAQRKIRREKDANSNSKS